MQYNKMMIERCTTKPFSKASYLIHLNKILKCKDGEVNQLHRSRVHLETLLQIYFILILIKNIKYKLFIRRQILQGFDHVNQQ